MVTKYLACELRHVFDLSPKMFEPQISPDALDREPSSHVYSRFIFFDCFIPGINDKTTQRPIFIIFVFWFLVCAIFSSGLAGDGGVMDGLRTELSAIVERSRIGDRKQQELEQIITRLEDELARHSTQTVQLEERLADKMAQIASLESKLGQRNLKVVDLQNELEEKISENGVLQREVRNIVKEYRRIKSLKHSMWFRTIHVPLKVVLG